MADPIQGKRAPASGPAAGVAVAAAADPTGWLKARSAEADPLPPPVYDPSPRVAAEDPKSYFADAEALVNALKQHVLDSHGLAADVAMFNRVIAWVEAHAPKPAQAPQPVV